uniref:ANK_REP_REGION domain-containing protein n=1 Tax=Strongyloides stercoralis TaxID=6248 RepID=A0A0K0E454_STRER
MSTSSNIKALSAVSLHNLAPQNSDFALANVKMLIEKYGYSVSEKRNEDGMTALHLAAMSDNLPMVKLLLHMGADYNVVDNFGRTPITLAAGESYLYLQSLIINSKKNGENKKKSSKFEFLRRLFSSKKMKNLFSKNDFQKSIEDGKQSDTQKMEVNEQKKEDYYTPIVKKQPPFNPNFLSKNTNQIESPPPVPPRKDYESIDDVINRSTDEDLKKDVSMLCNQLKSTVFFDSEKENICKEYSKTLNKFSSFDSDDMINEATRLDKLLKEEMNNSNTPTKKNKSPNYFNYLLLDPRLVNENDFSSFLKSIFYVGKGTASRPKAHFIEAVKKYDENSSNNEKIEKISELWKDGIGVISLQINQNVIEAEALSREAAIIEAININNLTNKKKGEYHGETSKWSVQEKELLGCICLKKAFHMFQIDEPRPIFKSDIILK